MKFDHLPLIYQWGINESIKVLKLYKLVHQDERKESVSSRMDNEREVKGSKRLSDRK